MGEATTGSKRIDLSSEECIENLQKGLRIEQAERFIYFYLRHLNNELGNLYRPSGISISAVCEMVHMLLATAFFLTGGCHGFMLSLSVNVNRICQTGGTVMRLGASALVLAATLFSANAFADPVKSSEDIVKFFANAANLGPSRGICVGTEDECKSKTEAPAQTGLDMLVNFGLNSAVLEPDAEAKLGEFAKALKDNRLNALSFAVEGYTDASGSAQYNDRLSQRRAQSVTAFLLSQGVEASRLSARGFGESHPRSPDPYDPINRRVEMRIKAQ